jgi:2'-5' RNA ligase
LTLAREARLRPEFDLGTYAQRIEPIVTEVKKVSLMLSERINGRLTYTELA